MGLPTKKQLMPVFWGLPKTIKTQKLGVPTIHQAQGLWFNGYTSGDLVGDFPRPKKKPSTYHQIPRHHHLPMVSLWFSCGFLVVDLFIVGTSNPKNPSGHRYYDYAGAGVIHLAGAMAALVSGLEMGAICRRKRWDFQRELTKKEADFL